MTDHDITQPGVRKIDHYNDSFNVKLAQRDTIPPLSRGEDWGEGNGHGKFHYQGWHNCHDR